jgi:hypothetical protein
MELPLPSRVVLFAAGQVFWLSAQPVRASLPIRVRPDSGRAHAPSLTVPDYSGGTAPDSHRVPDCQAVVAEPHNIPADPRQEKLPARPEQEWQFLLYCREKRHFPLFAFFIPPFYNFPNDSRNLD